jgi:hydrogenase nickel incorporation protein HypA/HybF
MHELSIAESLIDGARQTLAAHPGNTLRKIGLRIGNYAAVDLDSLTFCFDAVIKGTDLEGAALAVERTPGDELEYAYFELETP